MDLQKTKYQFTWILENYSYFAPDFVGRLESPSITYDGLESTSWVIGLSPLSLRERGHGSLFLKRISDDSGPETLLVNLNISITTTDGSTLYSEECEHSFRKGETCSFKAFVDMHELYVRKNTDFLPKDTLVVCCKLWKGQVSAQKVTQCTARTRIGLEKITFLHKIENFSSIEINKIKTLELPFHSKTGCSFFSRFGIDDAFSPDGSIRFDVASSDKNYCCCKKKLSIIDAGKNIIEILELDYQFDEYDITETKSFQTFTKQFILNNRAQYLPNDELNLLCTFVFCFEDAKIEEIVHDIPVEMGIYCNAQSRNDSTQNYKEKLSTYPTGMDDLKALYKDQLLTDVQLKTATKSFPAHKNVLCARSPVFRSMLSHDMKEKTTDIIKVDDLEDETVHQLLLFMYSDSLEDIQWESALKLYYSADKYDVQKLKVLCSIVLVENLSPSTAGELLLLAETHSDKELKKSVEDFILAHENEVFGSDEWYKLNKTNPELVMSTMQLKYKRNKGGK